MAKEIARCVSTGGSMRVVNQAISGIQALDTASRVRKGPSLLVMRQMRVHHAKLGHMLIRVRWLSVSCAALGNLATRQVPRREASVTLAREGGITLSRGWVATVRCAHLAHTAHI